MRALSFFALLLGAVASLALTACSAGDSRGVITLPPDAGGGGSGTHSGILPSKTLGTLNDIERSQLCQWGYDLVTSWPTCDGGGIDISPQDVSECAASPLFTRCAGLAVGQLEDCFLAIGQNPCGLTEVPAVCQPYFECVLSDTTTGGGGGTP